MCENYLGPKFQCDDDDNDDEDKCRESSIYRFLEQYAKWRQIYRNMKTKLNSI